MARYTGPATRKSRRLGVDLVGGDQSFEKRPYPPGQHGRARIKESEYRQQLQEKQKARFTYGVMEKQFRRYYEEAVRHSGKTGENLLQILESRLDNVVYRAGLARTRRMARQLVSHGHFTVNGVKVDIPSYRVSQYDIIDVKEKSLNTCRSRSHARLQATGPSRPGCRSWGSVSASSCTSCPSARRSTSRSPSSSSSSSTRSRKTPAPPPADAGH